MSVHNIDQLARMAADLIEKIEQDYGENTRLRTILIAAEIDKPKSTSLIMSSSDDRAWVQTAFLEQALERLDIQTETALQDHQDTDEDES